MQKTRTQVLKAIDRQREKAVAELQENRREWLEERIAIMTADGGLTEFQARQACQKRLQCRKAQKEFVYGKISDTDQQG